MYEQQRLCLNWFFAILQQNVLRRDCNSKCIEWIKGHYLEDVVKVYSQSYVISTKITCAGTNYVPKNNTICSFFMTNSLIFMKFIKNLFCLHPFHPYSGLGKSCICLFVWFDSLRPINNLSVIKGWIFLGWTSTKLGIMFLLKDTTQWCRWGSNPLPFSLESNTTEPLLFLENHVDHDEHGLIIYIL